MNYLSVFNHFVGSMLEELSLFSPVNVFLNRCFAQFHLRWSLRWVGGGGVSGTLFPYPAYLFSLINILSKCPIGFRHSGFYSVFILRYPGSLFTTIFFHAKLPNLFWKKFHNRHTTLFQRRYEILRCCTTSCVYRYTICEVLFHCRSTK